MRLGSLASPTEAQEAQRPTPGPSRFSFTAATVEMKERTGRLTLPRVGGRGGPNAMCRQKSTGPRPAELGTLEETESGRGRGAHVKIAQ